MAPDGQSARGVLRSGNEVRSDVRYEGHQPCKTMVQRSEYESDDTSSKRLEVKSMR